MLPPPGPEAKSDRLDCRKLAVFAQKGLLRPVRIPTEQEEADRQVVRLREQLVRKLRTCSSRSRPCSCSTASPSRPGWRPGGPAVDALRELELAAELRFCLDVMLDELAARPGAGGPGHRRLEELARADRHRETTSTLRTVPGVGPMTAMTFRLELHEPGRFADAGQVARMLGLAPQVRQSGPTRREGRC